MQVEQIMAQILRGLPEALTVFLLAVLGTMAFFAIFGPIFLIESGRKNLGFLAWGLDFVLVLLALAWVVGGKG